MRFLSIGECMVEMAPAGDGLWRQGFAGDSFNTAWYVRACLPANMPVSYFSAIGKDALSGAMLDFMQAAGIDVSAVLRHPSRVAGLYMITLTNGERSFTYWRENSAARTLADDRDILASTCSRADWLYLTGITLAILPPSQRETLLSVVAETGAHVVFDPNLRPRLWENPAAMRDWVMQAASLANMVLPSFDDEAAAFGDMDPTATAERYRQAGPGEIIVKNAGGPMVAMTQSGRVQGLPQPERRQPVDSTGAGDAFNGAYIAARMQGEDILAATLKGQQLAAHVISQHGALLPMTALHALK